MNRAFSEFLQKWENPFVKDQDLNIIFSLNASKRYDTVKSALAKGILISIRRGLYLIGPPYRKETSDPYEAAQLIYGPSYISFESALSYHGWIPEAVYAITCACAKRSKVFETQIGTFRYFHTPATNFFLNAYAPKEKSSFLIAEPWKAIADMIYSTKKHWSSLEELSEDLRIERETLQQSSQGSLLHIAKYYESYRVQNMFLQFHKEILSGY